MLRRALAVVVSLALIVPGTLVGSTPSKGTIEGVVTVDSRPLNGVGVALLDLDSGDVTRATSDARGRFSARVDPGSYALTTETASGLVVGRAPRMVRVAAGQVASAAIELLSAPWSLATTQDPAPAAPAQEPQAAPAGAVRIQHQPIACFVEGEFPLVDAVIVPPSSVARARVYFKAAGTEDWYFVEMVPGESGQFLGKLPKPRLEASPVSYYITAASTEFLEERTPEMAAKVVELAEDCEDRVAAIGPPGEVTVYSAATGSIVKPVGFAAGGAAVVTGILLALAGGAAALGVAAAANIINIGEGARPSPSPSPTPTPEPPPQPRPSPSPSPAPSPEPVCPKL